MLEGPAAHPTSTGHFITEMKAPDDVRLSEILLVVRKDLTYDTE